MTGKGLLIFFLFIILIVVVSMMFFTTSRVNARQPIKQRTSFVVVEDQTIIPIKQKLESIPFSPDVREQIRNAKTADELKQVMSDYHNTNKGLFEIRKCEKQGVGVFATQDIPAYTNIGRYPGYPINVAQQFPVVPKYILVRFNPADDDNNIYHEFTGCITPFLNEPSANESPNASWFQEENPYTEQGRYSIITARPIAKDEECTINYGPSYSRNYEYSRQAYSVSKNPTNPNRYDVGLYDGAGEYQHFDTIDYGQVNIGD